MSWIRSMSVDSHRADHLCRGYTQRMEFISMPIQLKRCQFKYIDVKDADKLLESSFNRN
jgi:hypothetical protein